MASGRKQGHHFVLVHGLGHGAWCWYKVATALRAAGHRVTALDLPSCGASPVRAAEVRSLEEYARPLLDAVAAAPPEEKVVAVCHSYGGLSLSLLMQTHPQKVAVAVFVSAIMLPPGSPVSLILQQNLKAVKEFPPDFMLDSTIEITKNAEDDPVEIFLQGREYMSQRLYQLSPPEDLTLATMMVRPGRLFGGEHDAVETESVRTEGGYGAVSRVYVVTEEDRLFPAAEQRRMAALSPGVEVRAVEGADHMPMHSRPLVLADLIMEIADQYD